ncbi:sugar-binding transcriptional regulator [Companilactobacillus metriopterae]|uniref:sugar-binding transcriptional regulator n=1 Tax=Companilactobacillus metriopterae TaxID=1909267 RepID=UPI00100BE646|nr:sugar-binding transcriptional regulator [Companilactobacillus metriopterae]
MKTDVRNKRILDSLKVARLYYESGMGQVEIAKKLNISRPTVSRLLQYALENGLVKIDIIDPFSSMTSLEQALVKKFNLKEAHVVPVESSNYDDIVEALGVYTADYLYDTIQDNDKIGVSWGRTMHQVADNLKLSPAQNVQVVELKGSVTYTPTPVYGEDVLKKFGDAFQTSPVVLPLPVVFENKVTHDIVLKDRHISKLIKLGEETNVVLFTVGTVRDEALLFKTGYFDKKEIAELQESAVGDICSRFFDVDGEIASSEINSRTIGIELDKLKDKDKSILVAGGMRKLQSIRGALKGNYANCLIIDVETAQALIEQD